MSPSFNACAISRVLRGRPLSRLASHPDRFATDVSPPARLVFSLSTIALAVLLNGCATSTPPTLEATRSASAQQPTNAELQLDYLRERNAQVNSLLDEADRLRTNYQFDEAVQKLDAASRLDPNNERGRKIGAALQLDRRDLAILQEADRMIERGSYDSASDRLRYVLAENPTNALALQLTKIIEEKRRLMRLAKDEKSTAASIMRTPVTLQFRDANVRMVFEALSRTSGLNVIFDRDVRADLKTTIFVTNAAIQDAVDLILLQNQLDKKVLNANTLFIYPATPAKQQEYQDLKVRTFQLSNIDAKQVQSLLKSLLKIKEVVIDEHANTVSIRGTPDTVRVAEQMIAAQDLPEPEVMLELQVLEVTHDRLSDLGIAWPNTFSVATPASANTWGLLHHLTGNQLEVSGLSATANFKLTDTDANLLASPRIRTRNKERAKILIGDKVPVISSSSTPSTSGPSYTQSIQYLDVGIKLEVEPQVYRDGDVGIKINLEVSNITKTISSGNAQTGLNSLAYQIGTRSASTSLRLRDGETQILGGLISDGDRTTADKVPGLGELPVVGRLFSDHNGDHTKTEIVLQITPHIIRPQLSADADTREVWSGTEGNVRTEQLRLDPTSIASTGTPNAPVVPGSVGGGTVGGAKTPAGASAQSAVPPTGSLGQPAAEPRTTPPPAPFGGRYSTVPVVPPPAAAVAPVAPPAADAGPVDGTGAPPAPPPTLVLPVQIVPAPPPPILQMPPNDMPSDNPLRPINGGY